jgi:hypothetical protein
MTKNSFQKLQTVINSNEQSYEQRGANGGKSHFLRIKFKKNSVKVCRK